jgi:hypothetical protein
VERAWENAWSGRHLPIYVINLDARADRWSLQERQARVRRIQIRRSPAFDGRAGRAALPDTPISDGARGLWLSFTRLYEALERDGVEVALVLEDDAVLGPFFKRRVRRILGELPATAAIVQAGFLGDSAWRSRNSILKNIRKWARPRSRFRELRTDGFRRDRRVLLPGRLRAGTHALLLRPASLPRLEAVLTPGALPLDRAFVAAGAAHPALFWRSRRNLAWQLPVRSDIPWTPITRPGPTSPSPLEED